MNNKAKKQDAERPYTICHMLASLDGKIDGAYMKAPECGPALAAYGELRNVFKCRATLYGTTTMAGGFADGLAEGLPNVDIQYPREDYIAVSDAENYVVSIDLKGILGWNSNTIEKKNRPKAHVIEVLSEEVGNSYLAYLRERKISYIFAGKESLDCKLALEKLLRLFSIDRLLIAGGGVTNWSFVQAGLLDELSLVLAPIADGSTKAVSIFEAADFVPQNSKSGPAAFRLKEVKALEGDAVWLRYEA